MRAARILLAAALCAGLAVHAREIEVGQKSKVFVMNDKPVRDLRLNVGDTISFANEDPFFHNVYSASTGKEFDLGSFPQGQSRKVHFDKEGTVEVECAIHANMKLRVEVVK